MEAAYEAGIAFGSDNAPGVDRMKYLKSEKIRRTLVVAAILGVLGLCLYVVLSERKTRRPIKPDEDMVVLEPAPKNRLFLSKDGTRVDSGGNIAVEIGGKEYTVLPDGSVWVESEDGRIVQVSDPRLINTVLTRALAASEEAFSDSDAIKRNISLDDLSESEIKTLARILGVSESALARIAEESQDGGGPARTLLDALGILDLRTLSDTEISDLAARLDVPEEALRGIVEKARNEGKAVSVDDAIRELAGSTMRQWIENGLACSPEYAVCAEDVLRAMRKTGLDADEAFRIASRGGFGALLENLGLAEKPDGPAADTPDRRKEEDIYSTDSLDTSQRDGAAYSAIAKDLEYLAALNMGLGNGSGGGEARVGGDGAAKSESGDLEEAFSDVGSSGGFVSGSGGRRVTPSLGGASLVDLNTASSAASSFVAQRRAQNAQEEKRNFLESFRNGNKVSRVEDESFGNMIVTGTPIKATLYTGINTDMPGMISAVVSENVYDSFTKTNILIPKFSRLIATYDSAVSWGQTRIMIAWTLLIRPDGVIVDLNGFQGVDSQGYAGVEGKVNRHITSMVAATAMASLISVSTGQFSDVSENKMLSALFSGGAAGAGNAANNLLNSAINRQNTITVEQGTKMVIMVNSNIELTPYKE